MADWVDNFDHDYIADNTYTLVDVVDTGMGYRVANGKLTFDSFGGSGWQQFLDPRWPGSDIAANSITVDVDATSGPLSLLTIGWSNPDWQNILSNVSASLSFDEDPQGHYFAQIQIYAWDNVTNSFVGVATDGDQRVLAGLTPPFTFEITTAITSQAYTATMAVIKDGQTLYSKTVGTNQNIWSWAMMGGRGSFPGIDGRSMRAAGGLNFPDLVLDRWTHSTPTAPAQKQPSIVHAGPQQQAVMRQDLIRPVGLARGAAVLR